MTISDEVVDKAATAFSDGRFRTFSEDMKNAHRHWMRRALEAVELDMARPGARRTDPSTSKRAALEHAPRASSHRAAILTRICKTAVHAIYMTAEEIGEETDINGAWKRVSELLEGGFIEVAGEREAKTGKMQQTYKPTKKGWAWWDKSR